jgi:hypothetical protein
VVVVLLVVLMFLGWFFVVGMGCGFVVCGVVGVDVVGAVVGAVVVGGVGGVAVYWCW